MAQVTSFMIQAGRVSIKTTTNCSSAHRLMKAIKSGKLPEDWKTLTQKVFQKGELFERTKMPAYWGE